MPDSALIPVVWNIRVIARPHPFRSDRIEFHVAEGATIAEIIEAAQPDAGLRDHLGWGVLIGDHAIPPGLWHRIRPRAGVTVGLVAVPRGGGDDKNVLATVLTVAAIAASFLPPPFGQITGAALALGAVGVTALAPPPKPIQDRLSREGPENSPSLTGARNSARPWQPVPVPLGTHLMRPDLAALYYTEIVGDDQFLRALFCWGEGPLQLPDETELKIGQTLLTDFEDVETEHRQGYDTDPPITLFTNQVFEETLAIELTQAVGWTVRTTQPDVDEGSIDVTFPIGLQVIGTKGDKFPKTVEVEIQFAPAGSGAFVPVTILSITENRLGLFRRGHRWTFGGRGQFDVRLRRLTEDTENTDVIDDVSWTALRSIRCDPPVLGTGFALTALRIRASDQLGRTIDELNGVVRSIVLDWDSGTGQWVERPSNNPASLFRWVLQHPRLQEPAPDSAIDLANLEAWHEHNEAHGFEFNQIIDFQASVGDTLDDLAAAGRASRALPNGLWGVTIDQPHPSVVTAVTPRVSFGFSARRTWPDVPHAWRVPFWNEDKGWVRDEGFVYDDGYDVSNATRIARLDLPGITKWDLVWKHGRYHLAWLRLRQDEFSFGQDIEQIQVSRGDPISLTHDVILAGLSSGRIKSTVTDGGGDTTSLTLDEACPMELGKTYGVAVRSALHGQLVTGVVTDAGEQFTVTLNPPIPAATPPLVDDLVSFGETGQVTRDVVVAGIEPEQDAAARLTCVDLAPAVHTADQGPIPPLVSAVTVPPGRVRPAVVSIRSDAAVMLRDSDGSRRVRVLVSFGFLGNRPGEDVRGIETRFRTAGTTSTWRPAATPLVPDAAQASIEAVEQGETIEIRARYLFDDSNPGPWTQTFTHFVVGTQTIPPDVLGLFIDDDRFLNWDYPDPPTDLAGFVVRRHAGSIQSWADAQPLHSGTIGGPPFQVAVRGPTTLLVKAFDTTGNNESTNAAVLFADLGDVTPTNVVQEQQEAPDWSGNLINGSRVGGELLADTSGDFWTGMAGNAIWKGEPANLVWSPQYLGMIYFTQFTPQERATICLVLTIDAPDGWTLDIAKALTTVGWLGDPDYPRWTGDPAAPAWTATPGQYFPWPGKLTVSPEPMLFRLTTLGGVRQARVSAMTIQLDVPNQDESFPALATDAAGTTLPLTKSYRAIHSIVATLIEDLDGAIGIRILDNDPAGPVIVGVNRNDQDVDATMNVTVIGVPAPVQSLAA